jgi:hypothetical protein
MNSSPQLNPQWRFPRAYLDGQNPAVLRFANGQTSGANLRVISCTGGLLSLPQPAAKGSQVKLIFLTGTGAVLGGAEMLPPVASDLQPFRFVSLAEADQKRVGELVSEHSTQPEPNDEWIEKLRTASAHRTEDSQWGFKVAGVVGLLTTGLATAAFLLHVGLLK